MNARTIALIAAVAIMGIGAIMILGDLLSPSAPPQRMQVAIAAQQIEPYTKITQDMIRVSDAIRVRDGSERGAYPFDSVIGLMTTDQIRPGDWLTAANAMPPEDVRFVEDFGLEVVTFQAGVDRTVGGKLRKGHIVNLYGFGQDDEGLPFTRLIEPELWVVEVSAGGQPVSDATVVPDPDTGELVLSGGGRERNVSLVTVAVAPSKAYNIINSLGAERLSAWVTLAANQQASAALATPVPMEPTATPGLPPDLAATATALWEQLQATPAAAPPVTGDRGTP